MNKNDSVIVFCDGGSRGNPGPSASGVAILNQNNEVIEEVGKYLGIQTNNYAEYSAVIVALEKMHELGIKKADFFLDSQLIVRQLNGQYRVKNANIIPLNAKVKALGAGLSLTFTHIYREDNTLADAIVNQVLDSQK
ncbi:ribonuclease HI family protein [Candidatus Saccharibacteria bacterium]|nr:ribonuclease HI family protein [Candidatus Saccharibacteria bacterium]